VLEPLRIDVYGGYAGRESATVWGRALEGEPPLAPSADDTLLDNLKRSLRQLESDEVPGLRLNVALATAAASVVTDDEGYFATELCFERPLPPGWWVVRASADDTSLPLARGASGDGEVLVPSESARFGIISDIDDTILQSHVQNRLKQAYVSLLGNAITRLSFEGTRDLLCGLERAGNHAPCFYVSRSAWNIHATLEHFISYQGLPKGPLVLRDVGLFNDREKRRGHKRREIERVFRTYPELPFILLGDSGQQDAFIYLDVAHAHPGRVKAILIRDVSAPARSAHVRMVLEQRCPADCMAMLFEDAHAAVRQCRERGLWHP
jgi:phosphatidate phosphatase APP1